MFRTVGPNRFTVGSSETRLHAFLRRYADPTQMVLLVAGVGSLYPRMLLEGGRPRLRRAGRRADGASPGNPEEPILPRTTMLWLVTIGVIMGAGTLGVISVDRAAFDLPYR